jgi:hypothetical protein
LHALALQYGEFSNHLTHLNLRSIRTPPGQPRNFPKGYGFDQVTCANYWFESLTWIALTAMTCDGSCTSGLAQIVLLTLRLKTGFLFLCSRPVYNGGCWADAAMGVEEAQDLSQGAWEKLSQEEHHDPLRLVELEP